MSKREQYLVRCESCGAEDIMVEEKTKSSRALELFKGEWKEVPKSADEYEVTYHCVTCSEELAETPKGL